jgi:hypothetical protein
MGRLGRKLGRLDRNFIRELLGPLQNAPPVTYSIWVGGRSVRGTFVYNAKVGFRFIAMQQTIYGRSRDTRWPLISICEMFRHYDEFDPLDLLIVHAILNAARPAARRRQRAG